MAPPLQEYGLPSSHTMNSIVLNFYIVHYLYDQHLISTEAAGAPRAHASSCLPTQVCLTSHQPVYGVLEAGFDLAERAWDEGNGCVPAPVGAGVAYVVVTLWVVLVAASRIYLGL